MLALGIDTSSEAGSVGLVESDGAPGPGGRNGLLGELSLLPGHAHARRLLPAVELLMATAGRRVRNLDLLAVAVGPGSFTGVRIGMATAKGLALALDRPVLGFSTLETIAVAVSTMLSEGPPRPICVLLEAGRGEVYRGLFETSGEEMTPLLPERAIAPERALEGVPAACVVCGSGVKLLPAHETTGRGGRLILPGATPLLGAALALRALALASSTPAGSFPAMTPNYLRLSDAEMTFKG